MFRRQNFEPRLDRNAIADRLNTLRDLVKARVKQVESKKDLNLNLFPCPSILFRAVRPHFPLKIGLPAPKCTRAAARSHKLAFPEEQVDGGQHAETIGCRAKAKMVDSVSARRCRRLRLPQRLRRGRRSDLAGIPDFIATQFALMRRRDHRD